jgi:hypothetical protein
MKKRLVERPLLGVGSPDIETGHLGFFIGAAFVALGGFEGHTRLDSKLEAERHRLG